MAPILTEAPATDLERLSARYAAMLEAEGVPAPLTRRLTVAAVLADLCALAGQPVPAAVADTLDARR